jgi:hypothetical protein
MYGSTPCGMAANKQIASVWIGISRKRTQASIMPQFLQPEMIVAKCANRCWSAGRNRPKTSPEYRRSQEGLIGRVFDVS